MYTCVTHQLLRADSVEVLHAVLINLKFRIIPELAYLMEINLVHVVPTTESTHIVDILEQCWCTPQIINLDDGMILIHADRISRALNCYPSFHGTIAFPLKEIVREGPVL